MKYLQKWGGGAGCLLLLLFLATSGALAQTTRYIDPVHGKTTGTCTSAVLTDTNGPCTLARVFANHQANGSTFLIRVDRAGGTVTLAAPTGDGAQGRLQNQVIFGTYADGASGAVEGTIRFTGTFTIAAAGQVELDSKVRIRFTNVTVSAGARTTQFFKIANQSEERITFAGVLTNNGSSVSGRGANDLDKLVVSENLELKGSYALGFRELTVHRGDTLTLSGVSLYLLPRRGTGKTDRRVITVDGVIQGEAAVMMTSSSGNDAVIRGGTGDQFFHTSDEYTPAADGSIDYTDCIRITGTGKITTNMYVYAWGNICYELSHLGGLRAMGSVTERNTRHASQGSITTDFIFRKDVVIGGASAENQNVYAWNDARIVFERTATILGDVLVEDGTHPFSNFFGTARTASVRRGVQNGGEGNYSCAYLPRGPGGKDNKTRGMHIPGVQFEDEVTIEGNLEVRANTLADGAPNSAKASAPACAPRVLFLSPFAKDSGSPGIERISQVKGKVAVEDTASFLGTGRIHLDSDSLKTGAVTRWTVHNLHVEGDLSVKGSTLGMRHASTSSLDGMCMAKDTRLTFGNHVELTGASRQVVTGRGSAVMLDALVVLGDMDVDRGPLTVKTLHVGPRAELVSTKDVKVTESLLLQGELSGELDEASTIRKLTYGSRNTDVVKKAALADLLDALSISVGSGELRLDEVIKTKNLGLCSGTLSLVDAESTTDSTLHVTDHITVQNGMLEKDTNDPGSISTDRAKTANINDRYILTYITPGKRTVTDALEWFDPRDVIVNHASAEITTSGNRSIVGKLTITQGKLMVDGMLTVGTSPFHRTDATEAGRYSVEVAAGELHTEGQDVRVHGKVSVNGKSKLMTGGGDLHVLGRVQQGKYASNTAQASIEKDAMINLGDGTLMLGPEDTGRRNNVQGDTRPDVLLTLTGSLTADRIKVPKGSKQTTIDASADSKMLQTVVFDGTMTPGTGNWDGTLYLKSATGDGKMLTVDSLSAMQGSVETSNKKVVIMDAVSLRSATIWPYAETTEFMGDLALSGTGGLNTEHNKDGDKRSVMIHGDFTQQKGTKGDIAGVKLHPMTTKTVMGDLMVAADASRYEGEMASGNMPSLMVHGGFHFAKNGKLNVKVEFTGKEAQEVMTGDTTALHSITVNNAKGLLLKSHVMQQKMATLTLRQGKIHSMPMDSMFLWTVQNVQVEQELRGRSTAQEGEKCGADNDEECKATILRGSRQSYAATPVVRHLAQGTAGAGFASGGYLFPVGREKGDMPHYRPLILQLPSDLTDTTAATVSPVMVPEGAMPAWQNLTVPTAGGSLTLDVHADLFWKVDLGEESLPTNTNIRLAAAGLRNVADASGLRIVQWDCMWKNPKLAGRRPAQVEAGSFAVNGYLSGVLHLTQEGIGLGSCAIFGIAANGIENPIDQADLSGGRANLQFIHNVPLPTSVDLHLGDIRIGSGMQFRSATAYRPVGAGSHELKIQPVGAPAEQAVTQMLPLAHNKNYVVIAHGSLEEPMLKVLETRMTSQVANHVDVLLVHGAADLGAVRVEVLDPIDPMTVKTTLAGNLMLDGATRRYASLAPSQQIFRVQSTDQEVTQAYEMDLYGYADQTLVLNLSGMNEDLTILGVDRNGMVIPTVVVTGVEESAELPTEFALHGNYPNPFNPSTQIQFDLPENAQVQIQIVDMLGREVITLPAQEMEAGANRSIELHATSLASGTYLYRLIAKGAEQRHVKTGRMTLVK